MKKIGILGGTFNPIHIGHLVMAQTAYEKLNLEKVLFIPSYLPPHKNKTGVIPAKHRFQMVLLAIKDNPRFEICDYEIKIKKKSYSINRIKRCSC